MKKITFLLFFTFLSTSMLFAQSKGLTEATASQTLLGNKNASSVAVLKVQDYEMNTVESVQTRSQDIEMSMIEVSQASKANNELAMKNRLQENEAKSNVSKAERDDLSDAIAKRLEKSKKNTSSLEKRSLALEKEKISLENQREVARKKAMQNYAAPSTKEAADKKSNQQNK
jgi:hypothetical protein